MSDLRIRVLETALATYPDIAIVFAHGSATPRAETRSSIRR
jgi:hypothetical protein